MATPQPNEIEQVREICRIVSFSEIEKKVISLSEVGWSATLSDLTEYTKVKNKFYQTSNDIPIEYREKRLAVTNRIRVRLGYSEINENGDLLSVDGRNESHSSSNVDNEIAW